MSGPQKPGGTPEPEPPLEGSSEFLLYQTEDGQARVHVRLDGDTVWLTQATLAELYQTTPQNITLHINAIYDEGELDETATCKGYLQVRQEGARRVQRRLKHYSLPMILAVGYRVRSARGVQFRQWATAHLEEYIVKGFTLDDQRLKSPPGPGTPDYFDELLARIRDIRASEKLFYRKTLEIYALSVDYDPRTEASQRFFATVQNKMHWAAHGHTAAELIAARANAERLNMGLTTWAGDVPRRADVMIAKNYLEPDEIEALNRIVGPAIACRATLRGRGPRGEATGEGAAAKRTTKMRRSMLRPSKFLLEVDTQPAVFERWQIEEAPADPVA